MLVEFENVKSHKLQELVCEVIEFGRKNLFPRYKHININIIAMRNKGVYGDCMYEDDRDFTIRFDKTLPTIEIITTLLHELVHVKQFCRGELNPTLSRWKTKDHTDTEYWDQPWEKEARRLQTKLVASFEKEYS